MVEKRDKKGYAVSIKNKLIVFIASAAFLATSVANAQMMGNFSNTQVDWNEVVEHTAREEQEGKELWDKLQAKEGACENLRDEQIHIVMGKRLSGCDTSAIFPAISGGWMPMMNMMWGGWSSPFGNNSTN